MAKTWTIVQFIDEGDKTIEAVPTKWITNDDRFCFWPETNTSKAISDLVSPKKSWAKYEIRILSRSYDNILIARERLEKAQLTSDFSDNEGQKRRRFPKRKFESTSEEESDSGRADLNRVPAFPKRLRFVKKINVAATSTNASQGETSFESQDVTLTENNIDDIQFVYAADSLDEVSNMLSQNTSCENVSNSLNLSSKERNPSVTTTPTSMFSQNTSCENVSNSSNFLNKGRNPSVTTTPTSARSEFTNDLQDFQRQMLRLLNLLNVKLDHVVDSLNAVQACSRNKEALEADRISFLMENDFPIVSKASLDTIEQKLQNSNNFEALVYDISKIGGDCDKVFIKRVMPKLFTFQFASGYSWDGLKGKETFRSLAIASAIKKAVTDSKSFQSTDFAVEKLVKEWLRRAKERSQSKRNSHINLEAQDM